MITPEEKNIKNKIDNLCDLDLFFNDSHLWKRVEAKLDQKKTRKSILAWYWMAASLIISLSFYLFLYPAKTPKSSIVATKTATTSTTTLKPEIVIRPAPLTQKVVINNDNTKHSLLTKDNAENNESAERLLSTEVAKLNSIDTPVIPSNTKEILQQPIDFKAQRVITLDLPVIPDKMMERESFAKRALRQVKNFNTEGKTDLRELNIEPRNVWAYLERSFFHDTTKIVNTKPVKQ